MRQIANIIGASGLVGHELLVQLLDHPEFEKVRIFVRRSTGIVHPRLEEQIIDFDQTESWKHLVKGDVLFSTLGTTIKNGKKPKKISIGSILPTSTNSPKPLQKMELILIFWFRRWEPIHNHQCFYSRMKGELEDVVAKLPFKKLFIIRPSILDGKPSGEKGRREGWPDIKPVC